MASVLDIIKHYQKDIEKHSDDEAKVLRCIEKLFQLKVTVQHLQDTGVGRTVNALRKEPGEVGQAARALVLKWKTMVAAEESDHEGDLRNDTSTLNGHGSGRESDDYSQHSRNSHDRHSSSKNSTPKSNHQEPRSNHQEPRSNHQEPRSNHQEPSSNHQEPRFHHQEHREVNGHHSGSKRKYHNSEEEDYDTKKKSRHTSSSEDDHKKQIVVKQEKLSDSESSDSDSSDSDSDSYSSESSREAVKVKTEIKQEIKKEKESPERHKSSSHSSKHSHTNHDDRKKELSSSKRQESSEKDRHSYHKSPKDASRHSEASKSSSHKHKSSQEKVSRSDKSHKPDTSSDEKKESKSSKHSSEKHKSSSHKHSSSDRHKSAEKHSSKERRSSSHTDKAPEKHKSSSEKDSKHKSKESGSSLKEKHNSSKDKSKERSSSSKEKSSHTSEKKRSSSESKSQSDKSKHKSDERNSEKLKDKSSSSSHKSKSNSSSKSKEEVPKKKSKLSNSEESGEDGIDCGSGASFAEALGMMVSPSKTKKKSFKDVNSPISSFSNDLRPAALLAPSVKLAPLPQIEISALPEISPNYKPRPPPKAQPHFSEEDAISAGISSKNQRTKVYSGNKVIGNTTTLYEMCVQVLQEHIDALEYTGGVPYDILKPVIDRATPQQLFTLEHYNPYLMDDTDHLWQKFCEKSFRNKRRQELETWREMYMRCQEEQESKLRSLTANIRLTQEAKKAPIKQTKMAYVDSVVKPPRNIARKQALHGTAFAASASPAARVASLSATPGVLKGGRAPPLSAPVSASSLKPKKAPLMQKALQFMRGRKR